MSRLKDAQKDLSQFVKAGRQLGPIPKMPTGTPTNVRHENSSGKGKKKGDYKQQDLEDALSLYNHLCTTIGNSHFHT